MTFWGTCISWSHSEDYQNRSCDLPCFTQKLGYSTCHLWLCGDYGMYVQFERNLKRLMRFSIKCLSVKNETKWNFTGHSSMEFKIAGYCLNLNVVLLVEFMENYLSLCIHTCSLRKNWDHICILLLRSGLLKSSLDKIPPPSTGYG